MGYYHIDNLYRDTTILDFKECYAMEKIHGTSAHIHYGDDKITFFSGGAKYETFVTLFNEAVLIALFKEHSPPDTDVCIYGEAYGGSTQGMSSTYGSRLLFVAFDVIIGNCWLSVPKAEKFCRELGLDFVAYKKLPTTLEVLDLERDADSIQAIRNGMGEGHMREGIVLRPLDEYTMNNGRRVIAKHKREEFRETATVRNVGDKLKRITEAKAIADEWVTEERLNHLLTSGEFKLDIVEIGEVIKAMIADIRREAGEEVVLSKDSEKTIGRETALMFKRRLTNILYETNNK